jgi:ABC-type transport system involved in cytochrome c biogenesis permease subunit
MLRPRFFALGLAIALATAIAIALSAVDDPAYQTLGRLAVQHNGRRKPLDTLAREAVKQIQGAPSIRAHDHLHNTITTWPAVAVLLDWSIRPQYWNDQDFIRDENGRGLERLEIAAIPLPANASYLAYTREALLAAPPFVLEIFPVENLDPASRKSLLAPAALQKLDAFQRHALVVFARYIDEVKRKERFLPATNERSDQRFLSWLEEKAVWVPIRLLLELDPNELERAGYQAALVEAFRTAYHELEASQRAHPGHASRQAAANLVSAARALGSTASKSYPTEFALALETHYNRVAPFSWAPWAYGIALVLFLISLGFADLRRHGPQGKLGRILYEAGIGALVIGLAIECYGFILRVMISGWAPVTNMYETVIWVALVTSVLGLILELVSRKTFAALAASAVSLLTTVLAATVSEQLLDPRIKSLSPVLRSNYWLTVHVLTIVSSYAAFALAMGLGMLAIGFYLVATYQRPAHFGALAAPLVPGLVLLASGALGVDHSQSWTRPAWLTSNTAYYLTWGTVGIGGVLTLMSTFALFGEVASRQPTRTLKAGLAALGVGLIGVIASLSGPGSGLVVSGGILCAGIGTSVAMLGLFGMGGATHATSDRIKPIARFLDRSIQIGVLLVAAGTILGGVWADKSWGRFWGWDPKEVWALITLLVYLVPLHGRFAGWVGTFGLVLSSVVCFGSVVMAWYGVNFVLGVGLHSYGFSAGGGQGAVLSAMLAVVAVAFAAAWRRRLAQRLPAKAGDAAVPIGMDRSDPIPLRVASAPRPEPRAARP